MCVHLSSPVRLVAGLAILCGASSLLIAQDDSTAEENNGNTVAIATEAKTRFLIVGKGKIADPEAMQQRGADAVAKIAKAASKTQPTAVIDALAENVMTIQQYRRGAVTELVTGEIFRERLQQLIKTTSPLDTVVIYTHSHGCRSGFERTQPLGGIVIDLPVKQLEHGGALLWDEYADLLLQIPAKHVVVLTMSCFSGGFVEYLNSPSVRERWQTRRAKEGRNFIVLTSQDANLTSDPILTGSEIINPFTYAISRGLNGEADGFALTNGTNGTSGTPTEGQIKDKKLTVGELIDFVLHATENAVSDRPSHKNTANPQATGSFQRDDVLFELE